ncbi:MAG: Tol-Pal system beta propeller repeat protein TolB [Gammaproteobacteria bacterium]|nr:Tol-Pal system beta propeller repeat protein TolB [Gammaproteobacteria bacterium]
MMAMLLLLLSWQAQARLVIEINEGTEGALPIAVVPFGWLAAGATQGDVSNVIAADLARSGRFVPLAKIKMPGEPHTGLEIDFAAWRAAGVEHMVVGRVQPRQGEGLVVEFQLFDVVRGVQLSGYSIPTASSRLRRVGHQISDIVYEKLTGQRGAFNTHVAYVTVERSGKESLYRLALADADGHDEQVILTSKQPLMSPAWSPDGERLAYVSFEKGRSLIYLQEVGSGERELLAEFSGLNSAPSFSPDGRRLALTLSRDGNPEIYLLDLASRALTRMTFSNGIDTEALFAPDGKSLFFTSDRGGKPQIYRLTLQDGRPLGKPQRITFEGVYNARAAISPDGKRLALVHGDGNGFHIAVQELQSASLRVLSETLYDESPSFAPNGSMIIYATERNRRGVLEAVSVDGSAHQRLGLSHGDVREPAWSPYILK